MPKRRHAPWKDSYYITCYQMAKDGMKDGAIANAVGVDHRTFKKWLKERKYLRRALRKARRKRDGSNNTFIGYVYDRLPDDLKDLWNEINRLEDGPTNTLRIESMLEKRGVRARQHLYFHALINSNFNASEACRKVNISTSTLHVWLEDPLFLKLVEEFNWHKGNFFEGALVELIRRHDSPATIFANKNYNRNRGYSEKVTHEHNGEIDHKHTLTMEEMDSLPLDMRKLLLEKMRQKREPKLIEAVVTDMPNPVDALLKSLEKP